MTQHDNPQESPYVKKSDFESIVEKMNLLMTGVVIVLFIGFAAAILAVMGPILDNYRFKAETYQKLVDKVEIQNQKLDILQQSLTQPQTSVPPTTDSKW